MITKFKATNFTVFSDIEIPFSPGINIFIGKNGTGKTHLLKAVYSATAQIDKKVDRTFDQKLSGVFLPNTIGRLVHRSKGRHSGKIIVYRRDEGDTKDRSISCEITTLNKAIVKSQMWYTDKGIESVFIPVKDMLANAPGFRSLYVQKKLTFEEVYCDIIDKAFIPIARGKVAERETLLTILKTAMSGRVVEKNETFYLKNTAGELEFSLLAEGYRKLGLLYRLIQNETLTRGSMLFWDEPEANLNPQLSQVVVRIIIELQRMGVQVFISTHDYVLLKEFENAATEEDDIEYHVLFEKDGAICHNSTNKLSELSPNSIDDTFARLLDLEISRDLADL